MLWSYLVNVIWNVQIAVASSVRIVTVAKSSITIIANITIYKVRFQKFSFKRRSFAHTLIICNTIGQRLIWYELNSI